MYPFGAPVNPEQFLPLPPSTLPPPPVQGTIVQTPDGVKCLCPAQAACAQKKWPWIVAAAVGIAVGTGIGAAAIGSRQKKR